VVARDRQDFFGRFRGASLLDPGWRSSTGGRCSSRRLEAAAEIVRDFLGRDFAFDAYREWLERGA